MSDTNVSWGISIEKMIYLYVKKNYNNKWTLYIKNDFKIFLNTTNKPIFANSPRYFMV